jgi:hypothetical protein
MVTKVIELLRAELEENEINFTEDGISDMANDLVGELHNSVLSADVITAACLVYARFGS